MLLLVSTLNEQSPSQSQAHTGALWMPLSASQSLNREVLAASVHHSFWKSTRSLLFLVLQMMVRTNVCPCSCCKLFNSKLLFTLFQGRCSLEPAPWSFLGLPFVTTVGVDRKISNVPSCTLHLCQQARHETWVWVSLWRQAEYSCAQAQFLLPGSKLWRQAEYSCAQAQFLLPGSPCNWRECDEGRNVSWRHLC